MKRIIMIFMLCILVSSVGVFAASFPKQVAMDGTTLELSNLLNRGGSLKNTEQISSLSSTMDQFTRTAFYDSYKKPVLWPTLTNTVLGFGIGSFFQKDWLGGGLGLGFDLVGTALLSTGAILLGTNVIILVLLAPFYAITGQKPSGEAVKLSDPGAVCLLSGLGVLVASRIFEIIRPIVFGKSYNKALNASLNKNPVPVSVSFAPHLATVGDLLQFDGFQLAARIEL